jgi:hypothetical protein
MKTQNLTTAAGVVLIGAFALTVYIGLYDKNLSTYQPLHWDLNWVFAAADVVAAAFLIGFPRKLFLVALGGVIWPILYVLALAIDVYTRLCLGGNQSNCWPSKTDAFDYLVLNRPNIAGIYGWNLWQGTMPTILALLAIAFVLSVVSLYRLRKPMKPVKPVTPIPGSSEAQQGQSSTDGSKNQYV